MYLSPNEVEDRCGRLNISNFRLGETVLFCPKCDWQADCHCGMNPICPECGTELHFVKVNRELIELIDSRKVYSPKIHAEWHFDGILTDKEKSKIIQSINDYYGMEL